MAFHSSAARSSLAFTGAVSLRSFCAFFHPTSANPSRNCSLPMHILDVSWSAAHRVRMSRRCMSSVCLRARERHSPSMRGGRHVISTRRSQPEAAFIDRLDHWRTPRSVVTSSCRAWQRLFSNGLISCLLVTSASCPLSSMGLFGCESSPREGAATRSSSKAGDEPRSWKHPRGRCPYYPKSR